LEMKISIIEIKTSVESLANRLDKVEDRISWLGDKWYELEHSEKAKERIRKYKQNMRHH
jgi:dihydroorotase